VAQTRIAWPSSGTDMNRVAAARWPGMTAIRTSSRESQSISSAGRPRGDGGAKGAAEHAHWQRDRGPGERSSGVFGIAYIRLRPPLTDKRQEPNSSEQAEAHAPVRSRTPTKQPSPAPAHDTNRRRTQRRRRVSGDRRQKRRCYVLYSRASFARERARPEGLS
jgi:hypothetical protein